MAIISRVDYENAGRVDAAPIMEGTKEKAPPLYLGAIACRTYQRERNRLGAAARKGSHRLAVELQVVLDRDALFDAARYLEYPRKADRELKSQQRRPLVAAIGLVRVAGPTRKFQLGQCVAKPIFGPVSR